MNTPQETLEQIVSDAKALLGITDDTQDAVLNYHARAVIQKVLNYCHREDLPDALVLIIVEMLVRQYTAWKMEEPDAGGEGGGTTSAGGTSLSVTTTARKPSKRRQRRKPSRRARGSCRQMISCSTIARS